MKKLFYTTLISISLLIFSCQRETNLGYNILPDEDLTDLYITDTLSVEVHTLKADSVVTGNVTELLLGEYNDPIFGQSKASFVLQFSMSESFINFKDTDIVDSVILTLPYNQDDDNVYGDLTKEQDIKVYRINVDLDNSINYYANEDTALYMGELVSDSIGFKPFPEDSLFNIKLNNSLGQDFISADESNYTSEQAFHNFFKGLYIKSISDDGDGAIVKYDLNENLLLSIYFHKTDDPENTYTFQATANSVSNARFNIFNHDYTSANFAGPIDDETLPQDSVAYLQSGGGLFARIKFPYLTNLRDVNKIVVNRAELIINSAPENISYENSYPAISGMYITGFNSDDSSILIPDYFTLSGYGSEIYSDNSYKFDIAAYIQGIFDGTTENNGINLYPVSDGNNINRSIITTGNNSNPIKLVITYTNLDK